MERKIQAEVIKYQNNISGGNVPPSVKDSLGSDFLSNLKLPNVNSSSGNKKDVGILSLRGSVEQQNDPLE